MLDVLGIEESGDYNADSDDDYSEGSQYFYDVDGTMLKNRGIVIPSKNILKWPLNFQIKHIKYHVIKLMISCNLLVILIVCFLLRCT